MLKTMIKGTLSSATFILFALLANSAPVNVKSSSTIVLNGEEVLVHFNDGDTFKGEDGRMRVVGINALETFGPVHQWLENSSDYLLDIANAATEMARNGRWTCTTNGKSDRYGRLLAKCDDLSIALLSAGLAHVYSVDNKPAPKSYINKQKAAQKAKMGMWKNGVPSYIISSLHSADEGHGKTYNRLISTDDGASELWRHDESYGICENVCLADEKSCMVYVPYELRYGNNRPECLRRN